MWKVELLADQSDLLPIALRLRVLGMLPLVARLDGSVCSSISGSQPCNSNPQCTAETVNHRNEVKDFVNRKS